MSDKETECTECGIFHDNEDPWCSEQPSEEIQCCELLAKRNSKLLVLVSKAEDLICEMVSIETPRRTREEAEEFFLSLDKYRRDLSS